MTRSLIILSLLFAGCAFDTSSFLVDGGPESDSDIMMPDGGMPDGDVIPDSGPDAGEEEDGGPDSGIACVDPEPDLCEGRCTTLMYDFENCGACFNTCDTNTSNLCDEGTCSCGGGPACSGGQRCVSSVCVDPPADGGVDLCRPEETLCPGAEPYCANLQTSPLSCGTCGNFCDSGDVCEAGTCVAPSCGAGGPCSDGETCCDGTCIDTNSDMMNCGRCGNVCDTGNSDECRFGSCGCNGGNSCIVACIPGFGCNPA